MPGVPLPEPFQALEPFRAWALATERERRAKRLSSSMEEIQAFYDALFPQLEAVVAYLDRFPLDQLPAGGATALLSDAVAGGSHQRRRTVSPAPDH